MRAVVLAVAVLVAGIQYLPVEVLIVCGLIPAAFGLSRPVVKWLKI